MKWAMEFISWGVLLHLNSERDLTAIHQEMLLTVFKNHLCLFLERFVLLECNQLNAFQKNHIHHTSGLFRKGE